jgi:membrane protein implicated in regulation of membrane protease activity
MFVLVLAALVMLFAGATFFSGWLATSPVIFIIYWIICGWLTLAAVLLAIFDMLMLRLKLRREKRELSRSIFGANDKTPPDV